MAKKRNLTANERRYRSIMAKLNFGHPLTASDRKFIRDHREFDWGPGSGYDKPNKRRSSSSTTRQKVQDDTIVYRGGSRAAERALSAKDALGGALNVYGRGLGLGNPVSFPGTLIP